MEKNWNVFVDGVGLFNGVTEATARSVYKKLIKADEYAGETVELVHGEQTIAKTN